MQGAFRNLWMDMNKWRLPWSGILTLFAVMAFMKQNVDQYHF